jgi:4-diphosphocytidyl-2C-methyl-D-erythritol kinase
MTPVGHLPAWWSVVVHPPVSVATSEAYALLDRRREEHPSETRPRDRSVSLNAVDALQRADFPALLATLSNDFHEPILAKYPAIAQAHVALEDASAQRALLSGSGSCVFTLCPNEDAARRVATKLDPATGSVFVAPLRADGMWR